MQQEVVPNEGIFHKGIFSASRSIRTSYNSPGSFCLITTFSPFASETHSTINYNNEELYIIFPIQATPLFR